MRRLCFVLLLMATSLVAQSNSASPVDSKAQGLILEQYGKLPLSFEANHGQVDPRVKFLSRAGGYSLFLTSDEAVLELRGGAAEAAPKGASRLEAFPVSLKRYPDTNPSRGAAAEQVNGGVLRMKLRGADPAARVSGLDELAGTSNYFIGNDPSKWRTRVPTYAKVKYEGIYSGIDLVYYGNQRQLEYDFIVAPGADPRRIAFEVRGARRILRDAHGELVFKMQIGDGDIRWHRPVVYQEKDGSRQAVAARYVVAAGNRVAFAVGKYDVRRTLYIDPIIDPLIYSTYVGGSSNDIGSSIAVDSSGNAYITGSTSSADFPVTPGAFQTAYNGEFSNAFVTKLSPTGSVLIYSTYLGGDNADTGYGIAVDSAGNAYVTGWTDSTNFPTTPGAFETTCCGAFVTKISAAGTALVYSTYLDGGYSAGIAVDKAGNAYVTGYAGPGFPTTLGAFQTVCIGTGGCANVFVTEINPTASALVYSTFLGGSGGNSWGSSIALDSVGAAFVTGYTYSFNFPVTPGAFQTACNGGGNECAVAFVSKLNPLGSALDYSTFLGYTISDGTSIAVDSAGNAYVTGATDATNFPTTPGAFQTTCGSPYPHCGNVFVTKINPTGSALVYSTYLGGSGGDIGYGIAIDGSGFAYVTGITGSTDFPVTPGAFQTRCYGGTHSCKLGDAFVSKMSPAGSALAYSTYLGHGINKGYGIATDGTGNAYITGYSFSTDFPVTPGAFQTTYGGGGDAFVTKMSTLAATTTTLSSSPNPSTYGQAVTFTAMIASSAGAPPDGETVSFMKGKTVLGTGTLSGGSASFTTSTLNVGTTSVKAMYGGDSNFAGSTSKAVKQVVEKAVE